MVVDIETWKDIFNCEGRYQVSDWGQVKSLDREIISSTGQRYFHHGRILKLRKHTGGYSTVCFSVNGKVKPQEHYVHQLVLKTFVCERPEGYDSCHNDGDPSNNHLSNLRWDTCGENHKDRYKHGYKSVLSKRIKRSDNVIFDSLRLAAKHMGVSHAAIMQAMLRAGKCCGYKWEYI